MFVCRCVLFGVRCLVRVACVLLRAGVFFVSCWLLIVVRYLLFAGCC